MSRLYTPRTFFKPAKNASRSSWNFARFLIETRTFPLCALFFAQMKMQGKATRTRSLPKHCACAAKPHVELEKLRFAHRANENSTCRSIKNTLPRRIPMAHAYRLTANGCGRLRTVANGFGRLRTVAHSGATPREHASTPRPPLINGNPSLRIREQ